MTTYLAKRTLLAALLVVSTQPARAQQPRDRIAADLAYLAADAREGRGVGTAGLDSAARYIAAAFAAAGLRPAGTDGFFQPFMIDPSAPAAAHAGVGGAAVKNVVAMLPGRGALAGEAVVVGAHYDHLGRGGFGSLDPDSTGVVHNGADDNASGTVALLEIARHLRGRTAPNARALILIAFTGEELGLLGSDYYVKHPVMPIRSTFAMINLDMVGRLRGDRVTVFGTETAREFASLIDSLRITSGLSIAGSGDGYGRSDQSSFYAADIPVLHFFTGTHEDYHRTTDDAPKINVDGVARIAVLAADLAWALATRESPLSFVDAEPPPPPAAGGGYGAYLGTIPDMSESPGGVRLTGVRAGSPAEAAGIKAGDVIVRLGDHEVTNLYQMTDALRAHKPGDSVLVVVIRDGQRLELRATLSQRGG
ncbi:MAG TPA: M28 family peptidase [Gemmatimonadales bacterium]|nr:M28 family peptidase [Gemmatimonadales bacterium]